MTKEYLKEFVEELRHVQGLCGFVADWLYEVQKKTRKGKLTEISALTDEDLWYDDRMKILDSLNVIEAEAGYIIDNMEGSLSNVEVRE